MRCGDEARVYKALLGEPGYELKDRDASHDLGINWRANRTARSSLRCSGCLEMSIKPGDRYCWNTQPDKRHVILCAGCLEKVNKRGLNWRPPGFEHIYFRPAKQLRGATIDAHLDGSVTLVKVKRHERLPS